MRAVSLAVLLQLCSAALLQAAEVVKITVTDLAFVPSTISAQVGDTVEWINSDFVEHTATAKSGDWDISIAAGKSAQLQLKRAGVFEYFCRFHPGMTGKISVRAIAPPG